MDFIKRKFFPQTELNGILFNGWKLTANKKTILKKDKEVEMIECIRYDPRNQKTLLVELIRQKYDVNDEMAVIHKGIQNPNDVEYLKYRDYRNTCKSKVDTYVLERDGELLE